MQRLLSINYLRALVRTCQRAQLQLQLLQLTSLPITYHLLKLLVCVPAGSTLYQIGSRIIACAPTAHYDYLAARWVLLCLLHAACYVVACFMLHAMLCCALCAVCCVLRAMCYVLLRHMP